MRRAQYLPFLQLARLAGVHAYTVDPPTTAPADTIEDCTNWYVGLAEDTCNGIATDYFIDISQLYSYNPSLANGCKITADTSYCVEENWGIPPPATTTSSTSTKPTSTSLVTPTPTQPGGMVAGCTKFYFIKKEDTCSSVLATNGLTIAQLLALNAGVQADCSGMWLEVYVCVAGPASGTTSTTTTSATTTTGGNGVATPTPTQPPSIVSNCNKFYFVEPGTSCSAVLSVNGITVAQLFAWNSGVGADCSGMWASVWLCVGVIGGGQPTTTSKTTSTSTTTPGNGISTPSPTQPPAIVSNCNKFYFVQPGTACGTVISANGITQAQLFAWNSGVNADCSGLWASVWVCVGVIGGSQPTTTSKTTSTITTTGNGVATPTPTQPGMVTNCRSFYKVADGDNCDTISTKAKVSVKDLQTWNTQIGTACNVWLGYYLCVAVL